MTAASDHRDIEALQGGVANAGAVVRIGSRVERPANPHSEAIHRFLRHVRLARFTGASNPIRIVEGREHLEFIPGDVPVPPFPDWAQTDEALASISRLVRGLHDASVGFDPSGDMWSRDMRDIDASGFADDLVMCHHDVCLENVVFVDRRAVALIDFDFVGPGRRAFDLSTLARMCVPVDDDLSAERAGWKPADRPARLRQVADVYGLDADGRRELMSCLDRGIERGGEFVLRHVEAGEPGFVAMWDRMGGIGALRSPTGMVGDGAAALRARARLIAPHQPHHPSVPAAPPFRSAHRVGHHPVG